MAALSSVFQGYLDEHADLCAKVGRAIATLREESTIDARRKAQSLAQEELQKADELIRQMDLETRSAAKSDLHALQARTKASREELASLREALKQAVCSGPMTRTERGSASSGDEAGELVAERARLLKMGERIHESTNKLQQAHRTVLETEEIGISIMGDLRTQRDTIMHAAGTLQGANESLARSKRTLATIGRRALANKALMWCMIIMLGSAVVLLLYLQLFGFDSQSSSGSNGMGSVGTRS